VKTVSTYTKADLLDLQPEHDSFVGIDSDGCVFDSMVIKQCQHFHPLIISIWRLEAIEPQVRAAAEFSNLYSKWRGSNRFVALLKVFELLAAWDDVIASGVVLPDVTALRDYVNSGLALGAPSLTQEVERTGDADLSRVLAWSQAVSKDIDENMAAIPPFESCISALKMLQGKSDAVVVSQTPEADLVKEWRLHKIDRYIAVIAGQELGTKSEHLAMATGGKYDPKRVILIGDAPGDRAAAKTVGACFFPINPGDEEASWTLFEDEAYPKFLAGEYVGVYEDKLIAQYDALLPDTPPWEQPTAG
jgi:phosphoglycolate phosphatase-like HAD superfamily hydrolase